MSGTRCWCGGRVDHLGCRDDATHIWDYREPPPSAPSPVPAGTEREARLWRLVEALDQRIDDGAGPAYHEQPLAQDWARVAKVQEEAGEAVDALIGITAQNHRKGEYGTRDDLFSELADVALTGVYAIQHFTKDVEQTRAVILDRADHHAERVGITLAAVVSSSPATPEGGRATRGFDAYDEPPHPPYYAMHCPECFDRLAEETP